MSWSIGCCFVCLFFDYFFSVGGCVFLCRIFFMSHISYIEIYANVSSPKYNKKHYSNRCTIQPLLSRWAFTSKRLVVVLLISVQNTRGVRCLHENSLRLTCKACPGASASIARRTGCFLPSALVWSVASSSGVNIFIMIWLILLKIKTSFSFQILLKKVDTFTN